MNTSSKAFTRYQWLAVVLTLASALLLAIDVDRPSYWIDEKISVDIVTAPNPIDVVRNVIDQERRPPAYHLSLWLWMQIAGDSERAARLHSAAWAILLVPIAYQLARRLSNPRAAVWVAALIAVSPILIAYGQTVRYYTMVATLSALSYALFLDVMRRDARHKPWLLYVAVTLLLLYCDFPAYGVIAAQNIIALAWWIQAGRRSNHPRWRWIAAQALMGAIALLWLPIVLVQGGRDFGAADLSNSVTGYALKIAYPFYAWFVGETQFPWSPAAIVGGLVGLGLAVYGFTRLSSRDNRWFWLAAFALPFVVSQALLGTVATDSPFVNAPARTMACAPLLIVLVGAGLASVPRRWMKLAACAILALTYAISLFNYYAGADFINTVYNTPAREVASAIGDSAQPQDLVVSEGDSIVAEYLPPPLKVNHQTPDRVDAIQAYLAAYPDASVWQVAMGRDRTRNDTSERLARWLSSAYTLESSQGFAEQDPIYRALKSRLLGREAYRYRLVLDHYTRQP